ncbi:MAG: sigma-70 family RNA polymerase sigma factor, partial [Bacteroidota bacterium]|nr:sigma-70 family RNA polymerase sigma factor [Bacteroidota bacterium]
MDFIFVFISLIKPRKLNLRNSSQMSDHDLLEHFYRDQDNKWLGILLSRYTMMILGVCMKYMKNEEDAKDCVQQVFLKIIRELPKYRVDYFKSWMYMIAKNHCLMELRDKGKFTAPLTENMGGLTEETEDKSLMWEKDQLIKKMMEVIDSLNTEQAACIRLFYLEKKSYQEISDLTGYSLQQVKSHIQNGKRNLKLMIGPHQAP